MPCNNRHLPQGRRQPSWTRFIIGILCLCGTVFLFTRGVTPPGIFGEVVRHNRAAAVDATYLVSYDVENIVEIQAGLAEWWGKPDTSLSSAKPAQIAPTPVSR